MMTPEQKDKFLAHLQATMKGARGCPFCGSRNFSLGPMMNHLVHLPGGAVNLGDHVPTATLICDNCFYVASFAAAPMGLVSPGNMTRVSWPQSKTFGSPDPEKKGGQ